MKWLYVTIHEELQLKLEVRYLLLRATCSLSMAEIRKLLILEMSLSLENPILEMWVWMSCFLFEFGREADWTEGRRRQRAMERSQVILEPKCSIGLENRVRQLRFIYKERKSVIYLIAHLRINYSSIKGPKLNRHLKIF